MSSEVQGATHPDTWRLATGLPAPAHGRQAATASRPVGLTILPEQCLAGHLATFGDILVFSVAVPLTTMGGGQDAAKRPSVHRAAPPLNNEPQTSVVPQLAPGPDVTDSVRSAPVPAPAPSCPAGPGPWQPFSPCSCPSGLCAELILLVAWMPLGPNHDLRRQFWGFIFISAAPPLFPVQPPPCTPAVGWAAPACGLLSPGSGQPLSESAEAGGVGRLGNGELPCAPAS